MAIYQRPSHPHAFGEQQARQQEADRRLGLRETRQLLTVDRGVTANVPAPGEGQLMVEGTDLKWYAQGAWHSGAATSARFAITNTGTIDLPDGVSTQVSDEDLEILYSNVDDVGWTLEYTDDNSTGDFHWTLKPVSGDDALYGEGAWIIGLKAYIDTESDAEPSGDVWLKTQIGIGGRHVDIETMHFIPAAQIAAQVTDQECVGGTTMMIPHYDEIILHCRITQFSGVDMQVSETAGSQPGLFIWGIKG